MINLWGIASGQEKLCCHTLPITCCSDDPLLLVGLDLGDQTERQIFGENLSQCWTKLCKTRIARSWEVHLVAIPSGQLPSGHCDIIQIYNQNNDRHIMTILCRSAIKLSEQRSKRFHSLSIFTFSGASSPSRTSLDFQYCGHFSCARTSEMFNHY